MIDINLIPISMRKGGEGGEGSLTINISKEVLFGVGTGLILLLVTIHLILGAIWLLRVNELSHFQAKWQQVLPDRTTLDAIYKESKDLKIKYKMISGITIQKSVNWAAKFNTISDALPKGLWFRKMVLNKDGLSMEGSVVSKNQNEITDVGEFLSTLKQNDDFMKDFSSLEVNSIQRGKNNAVEVTDFTVMAKLK